MFKNDSLPTVSWVIMTKRELWFSPMKRGEQELVILSTEAGSLHTLILVTLVMNLKSSYYYPTLTD